VTWRAKKHPKQSNVLGVSVVDASTWASGLADGGSGFAKLLARAGEDAEIGLKVHPHMLRHACGYALANKGLDTRTLQAYLGHRSINSTTRYAALAPGRFKNVWGRA
jgi:site-specific recombinase XerD